MQVCARGITQSMRELLACKSVREAAQNCDGGHRPENVIKRHFISTLEHAVAGGISCEEPVISKSNVLEPQA